MAGYKGHLAGATVFCGLYLAGLLYISSVELLTARFSAFELLGYPLGLFGLCLMFALWPDTDTDSKGQNLFYSIFFLIDVVLIATQRFEEAAYLGLFALLPALGHHRGWTHSWWAMLLVPAPLVVLPMLFFPERPLAGLPFYGAAVVGYLSHLFMDGLVTKWLRRR